MNSSAKPNAQLLQRLVPCHNCNDRFDDEQASRRQSIIDGTWSAWAQELILRCRRI